jgi:hypothetical protein
MPFIVKGSHADLIREEFEESLRRPSFWLAAAREAVPVIGVFFFGWEAIWAAAFFGIESVVYLATRIPAAMTFDPDSRGYHQPTGRFGPTGQYLGILPISLALIALVVGTPAFFSLTTFPKEHFEAFVEQGGLLDPGFLTGVAVLLFSEAVATFRFIRRAPHRTPEQREQDEIRIQVMYHRALGLLTCGFLLGFLVRLTPEGKAFVLLPFLVMLYFEGCPRDVQRRFGRNRR